MGRYEEASVKAYVSLAVLNAGQAVVFTVRARRHHGAMRLRHRRPGPTRLGDFVMINAMMIQLVSAADFNGMVYLRSSKP